MAEHFTSIWSNSKNLNSAFYLTYVRTGRTQIVSYNSRDVSIFDGSDTNSEVVTIVTVKLTICSVDRSSERGLIVLTEGHSCVREKLLTLEMSIDKLAQSKHKCQ